MGQSGYWEGSLTFLYMVNFLNGILIALRFGLVRSSPHKKTITRYSKSKRLKNQLQSTGYKRINPVRQPIYSDNDNELP